MMLYTATLIHDNRAGTFDVVTVQASRIDHLERRMAEAARYLLETYHPREREPNGITVKPLPLVRFDGACRDIAREARRRVQGEGWTAATCGDTRWALSAPLDTYHCAVEARRV
jgi:hypothetical protein